MTQFLEAPHWRDLPPGAWRWPSFKPAEIACRGTGRLKISVRAMDALQALRDRLGKPLIVRSAYRSPEHNKRVGGAPRSRHVEGDAFDISMANHEPNSFERAARECGFQGFGRYPEPGKNFLHIDMGPARFWGTPWPLEAAEFEPEPERKPVMARPDGQQQAIAAAGIGGAGATEALQQVTDQVQGLTPYLETARWVFLALALIGVGLTVWRIYQSSKRGVG
jgi:hypothetical protein